MTRKKTLLPLLFVITASLQFSCSGSAKSTNNSTATSLNEIQSWVTKADQSVLLQKTPNNLSFSSRSNQNAYIDIDSTAMLQKVDGFGYTLTGGSAYLINKLS